MPTPLRLRLEVFPGRSLVPTGVVGQSCYCRWTAYDDTDGNIATLRTSQQGAWGAA